MSAPNWLPDWRDEAQYPAVECMLSVQWAWEFLRRNPEYQADFAELKAQDLGTKWRISLALDPSTPSSDELFVHRHFQTHPSGGFRVIPSHFLVVAPEMVGPEQTAVNMLAAFIDLSLPLAPQLERVEQVAKSAQNNHCRECKKPIPKVRNYRPQDYGGYLRLLDGLANGVSLKAVSDVLFGVDSDAVSAYRKAQKNKKAALELVTGGYLDICRIAVDAEVSFTEIRERGNARESWIVPYT